VFFIECGLVSADYQNNLLRNRSKPCFYGSSPRHFLLWVII